MVLVLMVKKGAQRVLEIFYEEIDKTMAFCGHTDINEVDRSILIDVDQSFLR